MQIYLISLVACLTCIGRCRGNWLSFPDRFFFSEVRPVLCSSIYHRLNSRSAIFINLLNRQSFSRTLIYFIPCSLNAESTSLPNLALIWYFNSAFKAVCLSPCNTGQLYAVWLAFQAGLLPHKAAARYRNAY